MSCLSLMEAKLPPGFRFHPRDEELVCDYLAKKVTDTPTQNSYEFPMMTEVDLNKVEPWDLPDVACIGGKEWYFFSLLDRKYATGLRMNRATLSGYWKATGKDRRVNRKGKLVGMRKTLVFYTGRAPKGKKTEWVMHEFRLQSPSHPPKITFKEEWVLGRVFYKNVGGTCTQHISQESCSFDEGTRDEGPFDEGPGSPPPPLPPNLPDPSLFFDNQTPLNVEVFEQVPCFSNFTQTYPTPTLLPDIPLLEPNYLPPTAAFLLSNHLGSAPDLMASLLDPLIFCDDEDIIKALLDHQTHQKMMDMMLPNNAAEGVGGGGGGGGSPGSHFSGMELWNDNYWF